MDVAMNGPAAEGNLKTGLFTKRDKVKSKKGNQVEKKDKHIRKQEINAAFFQGPSSHWRVPLFLCKVHNQLHEGGDSLHGVTFQKTAVLTLYYDPKITAGDGHVVAPNATDVQGYNADILPTYLRPRLRQHVLSTWQHRTRPISASSLK